MSGQRLRVVVTGGGVAGLETLLALRALGGDAVRLHLISPGDDFIYRPLEVLEPFNSRTPARIPWARILDDCRISRLPAALREVDIDGHRAHTTTLQSVPFDVIVLAPGASVRPALPGSITVGAPGAMQLFAQMLYRLRNGQAKRMVFAIPPGITWTLPIYELALMTARLLHSERADAELSIATAESEPLAVFGAGAGDMVADLLACASIRLHINGLIERRVGDRIWLELPPGPPVDAIVAMPTLKGPGLDGLRSDDDGFLLVDEHSLVKGETDVYAAGDATSFPVKQGGLAAQQALAAATHIARRVGADVKDAPFEPILRGMLLTGGPPHYLRLALAAAGSEPELSTESPWWPPVKIVGRYLAPYLASHAEWADW